MFQLSGFYCSSSSRPLAAGKLRALSLAGSWWGLWISIKLGKVHMGKVRNRIAFGGTI